MFNIYDIINRGKGKERKEPPEEKGKPETSPVIEPPSFIEPPKAKEADISISSALSSKTEAASAYQEEAKKVYEEAVTATGVFYNSFKEKGRDFKGDIQGIVKANIEMLVRSEKELLKSCLADYAHADNYVIRHALNVSLLSLSIAKAVGYDNKKLLELGMASLMHDIGLMPYLSLVNKSGRFSKEEYREIKKHPEKTVDILSGFSPDFSREVIEAVYQEHERLDGSGYPRGLKEAEISEYAKIIGLADVYEAKIHWRPYREKYTALETIKLILENKNAFDNYLIKVLIERVGIFPVGMSVRLNTREIAEVVGYNPKLPMRPLVRIVFDAAGNRLSKPKMIDLAENSMIYIQDCVK